MKYRLFFLMSICSLLLSIAANEADSPSLIPPLIVMCRDLLLGYKDVQFFNTKDGNKVIHNLYDRQQNFLGELIIYEGSVIGYAFYPSSSLENESQVELFKQMVNYTLNKKEEQGKNVFSLTSSLKRMAKQGAHKAHEIELKEIKGYQVLDPHE